MGHALFWITATDVGMHAGKPRLINALRIAWRRLINPFDLVVLAGAVVNLLVVAYLVGYWLLHG